MMRVIRHVLAAVALVGAAGVFPAAANAADKVCKLAITGTDLMQYDKQELAVAGDCTSVELTLTHGGKLPKEAMGHNWVLVNAADLAGVAQRGMGAGLASDYVAAGDKRVLAHTRIIGGGDSTSVTFATSLLKPAGSYSYLCTFPGHNALMHGTFTLN
ncbi:MAG: azurin [Steroidobacteraceae bacterium]